VIPATGVKGYFEMKTLITALMPLIQLLASDARVITDGGGKVRAALNVIEGADRVAEFPVEAKRKRPDAWWREDFRTRFANSMACRPSSWMRPKGRSKPRHSKLRVM
jgi:hypothetical protein